MLTLFYLYYKKSGYFSIDMSKLARQYIIDYLTLIILNKQEQVCCVLQTIQQNGASGGSHADLFPLSS